MKYIVIRWFDGTALMERIEQEEMERIEQEEMERIEQEDTLLLENEEGDNK